MSTVFPSLPYPTWLDSGKLSQLGMRVPFREVLLTIEHSDWSVTCNLCRDPRPMREAWLEHRRYGW